MAALKVSSGNRNAICKTHNWGKILANPQAASAGKWSCVGQILQR